MATIGADDVQATGYFLPEESWLRLWQLREYVAFLANLARPRRPDEDKEFTAAIRVGDVAVCLDLLGEQLGQVLDGTSWPAERRAAAAARDADARTAADAETLDTQAAEPDVAVPSTDEAAKRYAAGVTLAQIDEINLLLDSLRALGDVVTCSGQAGFADATLSVVGDAIFRDAGKLRGIIDEVDAQRLGPPRVTETGVREEQASYLSLPARLPKGGASYVAPPHPTCQ